MAKKLSKLRAAMSAEAQAQASAKTQQMLQEWPESVKAMAGSWPDFPEAETLREDMGSDVKRESLCDQDADAFGLWKDKATEGSQYQNQLRDEWERPNHNDLRTAQSKASVSSEELIRTDRNER